MKVFATSDLHGNLSDLDFTGCELGIIAGDIAPLHGFGRWFVKEQLEWVNTEFQAFTDSFPKTQFVVIPGNHDFFPLAHGMFGGRKSDWTADFGKNVAFLLDSGFEFNGLKIYGTPRIPIISHRWAFENEHDVLVKWFNKIPTGLDILVSHTPPRLDNVDYSFQTADGPFGSGELENAIIEKKPKHVFCGHIHSGDHDPTALGHSWVTNVSRLDENYEIGYEIFKIEI